MPAEVIDASDLGAFLVMKQCGLLQPYRSATTTSIPESLRDPDFAWVAGRLTQCVIQ
jgi:ABC-type Fe3+ transport system substrate-binding protein